MKQRTVIVRGKKKDQDPDSKSARLTQKARGTDSNVRLAKRMGTSCWTVWMWSHGVIEPNAKHLKRLKQIAGK